MPRDLTALMSARVVGKTNHGDITTWKFCQDIPIPSYLIALVVGCLESRQVIVTLLTTEFHMCMVSKYTSLSAISNSLQASWPPYFGVV